MCYQQFIILFLLMCGVTLYGFTTFVYLLIYWRTKYTLNHFSLFRITISPLDNVENLPVCRSLYPFFLCFSYQILHLHTLKTTPQCYYFCCQPSWILSKIFKEKKVSIIFTQIFIFLLLFLDSWCAKLLSGIISFFY